jgi:repressor LexA
MAKGLTKRQREILEFLVQFSLDHGFPASVKDIMKGFSFKSPASVTDHMRAIARKGYIKINPRLSRGTEVLAKGHEELGFVQSENAKFPYSLISLPVVGKVAAGQPALAVEDVEDKFQVDRNLFTGNPTFMLRVSGESMIEIGIFDGDFVAIEKTPIARDGETVVVMIDGEATVKTFYRDGNLIRLQPENQHMEAIMIDPSREPVEVVGRVVGLVRRM